jgi:hypothetical protein
LLLAYTAWIHHGIGPARPGFEGEWYTPQAFLFESDWTASLLRSRGLAFTSLGGPALLLGAAIALLSRSALATALGFAAATATWLFLFYGLIGAPTWQFFGWRGSAVLILTALPLGFALASPRLATRWLRLGWPLRIASYLPFVAFGLGFLRNATGTDPSLPFAISPWPAVPIFGLEVGALFVAIVLGTTAAGGHALAREDRRALFVALALVLPALGLGLGDLLGLFPFRVGAGVIGVLTVASAAAIALASFRGAGSRGARTARRVRAFGVAAVLVAAPVLAGEILAFADYTYTREVSARRVIEGLQRYVEREQLYPDELETLLETGDLAAIPTPTQGFGASGDDRFEYQNFGMSYLLGFTATRWVQCAYTPPVVYDDEEERLEALEELGEGAGEEAWSCPSRPPELW